MSEQTVNVVVDGTTMDITLQTASVFANSGVQSFNGRDDVVVPAQGDYPASFVVNDSSVSGAYVSDALDTLEGLISSPVLSFNTRTGAVVSLADDYAATQVTNDSTVTGLYVSDALDALLALASGTKVDSFNGRTGIVTPEQDDYTATLVDNDSSVIGDTVKDALEQLQSSVVTVATTVSNLTTTDVPEGSSLYYTEARVNANTLVAGAEQSANKGIANGYASLDGSGKLPSSQLPTTSVEFKGSFGSAGSTTGGDLPSSGNTNGDLYICDTDGYNSVEAGLTFDSGDQAIYDGVNWSKIKTSSDVNSVFGRTGVIVAADGDYSASLITNDSSVVGIHVSDALNTLSTSKLSLSGGLMTGNLDMGLHQINNVSSLTSTGNITAVSFNNVALTDAGSGSEFLNGLGDYTNLVKSDITDFSDADYATAAQGVLADSALQNGDNVSELINDAGYLTSLSEGFTHTEVSTDYTQLTDGEHILVDASGGDVVITLLAPSQKLSCQVFKVSNAGGRVYVRTPSGTLQGDTEILLPFNTYSSLSLYSSATAWWIK